MKVTIVALFCCPLFCSLGQAQNSTLTIPFSDASRPGRVTGSLINGCFTVEGYNGKEVVVEGISASVPPRRADGLRRISPAPIETDEASNTIRIRPRRPWERTNISLRVPFSTSLNLKCTNSGNLVVHHVNSDLELQDLNGRIEATGISGSVIAHALHAGLVVEIEKAPPDKPMSFSTLNGDIDVTLPPDIKATVRIRSDRGEVYSDFDIKLDGGTRIGSMMNGTINGGGIQMDFRNLNGNIYLRKGK